MKLIFGQIGFWQIALGELDWLGGGESETKWLDFLKFKRDLGRWADRA